MLTKKNTRAAYEPANYEGLNLTYSERTLLSHHFLPDDAELEDDQLQNNEPDDDRAKLIDPEQEAEDDEPVPDEEDLEQNDLTTEQAGAVEWDPEDDE